MHTVTFNLIDSKHNTTYSREEKKQFCSAKLSYPKPKAQIFLKFEIKFIR